MKRHQCPVFLVPVVPTASRYWIVWDNSSPLQVQAYFSLFAGVTLSQAWTSQLLYKWWLWGSKWTYSPSTQLYAERKTEQLLLFKSLFSFYSSSPCPSTCSGLFQTASSKPDLVLLSSLRFPESSLRAQDWYVFPTICSKDRSSHRAVRPKTHEVINDSIYIKLPFGYLCS